MYMYIDLITCTFNRFFSTFQNFLAGFNQNGRGLWVGFHDFFPSLDNESLSNSELEVVFNEMAGLVFQGVSVEVTSGDSIPQ